MFDMGLTEMMLIGIVALVVIGPDKLPGVARTAGKYFGRLKRFVSSVKSDVESELRADELREILSKQQKELDSLKNVMNETSKAVSDEFKSEADKPSTESLQPSTDNNPSGQIEQKTEQK
ncbi:MAG: sec-independent protein translocase protein TatB [Planctomycetota bacterium]|jgi:sec-independent protein translocase protein TatB